MEVRSEVRTSASLLRRLHDAPDDQSAWSEFVARYEPRVLTWCARWGLQEADSRDVCQVVLVRLATKMRGFVYDPAQSFRGWLYTLARNAWNDFTSERLRKGMLSGTNDAASALYSLEARDDLERHLSDLFDLELLEEATARVRARVEPKTWEAFQLTALQDQPGAAVAARLGMPLASVFKARSNVQKWLREEIQRMEGTGTA